MCPVPVSGACCWIPLLSMLLCCCVVPVSISCVAPDVYCCSPLLLLQFVLLCSRDVCRYVPPCSLLCVVPLRAPICVYLVFDRASSCPICVYLVFNRASSCHDTAVTTCPANVIYRRAPASPLSTTLLKSTIVLGCELERFRPPPIS